MEKMAGVELERVWEDLTGPEKFDIIEQVVGFQASFASTRFPAYGSLYFAEDLPEQSSRAPLSVEMAGTAVPHSRFAIGPSVSRAFFDDGRAAVDLDRGPCMVTFSTHQLHAADR
jgi:hypothetical protein